MSVLVFFNENKFRMSAGYCRTHSLSGTSRKKFTKVFTEFLWPNLKFDIYGIQFQTCKRPILEKGKRWPIPSRNVQFWNDRNIT